MVARLVALSLALSFAGARAGEQLPLLHDKPFQAVILPADAENSRHLPKKWELTEFWTPSPEEVTAAEKPIAEFIAHAAEDQTQVAVWREIRAEIRDHPEKFVRQYFGGIRSGHRVIVCNAIRLDFGEDFVGHWRDRYIQMYDATGNWRIEYDPSTSHCDRFYVDGGF